MAVDYIAPFSYTLDHSAFTLRDGNGALILEGRIFGGNAKDLRDILQRTVDCLNALDRFHFDTSPAELGTVTRVLEQRLPLMHGNVLRVATEASAQQAILAAKSATQALASMEALKNIVLNSVQTVGTLQTQVSQKAEQIAQISADADEIIAAAEQTRIKAANVSDATANLNASVESAQSAAQAAADTLAQINLIQGGLGAYITRTELQDSLAGLNPGDMKRALNLSDLGSAATARANLGLGSVATQSADAVAFTGGTIEGVAIGVNVNAAGRFTTLYATDTLALRASVAAIPHVPVRFATGSKLVSPNVPNAMEWDGILLYMTQSDGTRRGLAYLDSPTFTGFPRAVTAPSGDNSLRIATTAFVQSEILRAGGFSGGSTGTINQANVAITGGSINNTPIGLSTARSAAFTALTIKPVPTYARSRMNVLAGATNGLGTVRLTLDGGNAAPENIIPLPNNSVHMVKIFVGGKQIGGTAGTLNDAAIWEFSFGIKRGQSAAETVVLGFVAKMIVAYDEATLGWDVTVSADSNNGGFSITATGQSNKIINWVATVISTEIS